MNTRPPTTDPLDDDEAALARIVHALPAGDPPPALDARILQAASNALATSHRRRAAWLSSTGSLWGIGSAAAAVLAIGIAWQRMNPPTMSLPATSPEPVAEESADDGRLNVEFKEETPRDYNHPPPPAAPVVANRAAAKPALPRADQPAPSAFPHDGLDEHVAQGGREIAIAPATPMAQTAPAVGALSGFASDAMAPAPRAEAQSDARQSASAGMDANVAAKAASAERDRAGTPLDTITVTGTRLQSESAESLRKRVATDERLYPESWLLRIHNRLKDGDVSGARVSLRLFVARYPQQPVPAELKPLLGE